MRCDFSLNRAAAHPTCVFSATLTFAAEGLEKMEVESAYLSEQIFQPEEHTKSILYSSVVIQVYVVPRFEFRVPAVHNLKVHHPCREFCEPESDRMVSFIIVALLYLSLGLRYGEAKRCTRDHDHRTLLTQGHKRLASPYRRPRLRYYMCLRMKGMP